jgi:hypothetical protein
MLAWQCVVCYIGTEVSEKSALSIFRGKEVKKCTYPPNYKALYPTKTVIPVSCEIWRFHGGNYEN